MKLGSATVAVAPVGVAPTGLRGELQDQNVPWSRDLAFRPEVGPYRFNSLVSNTSVDSYSATIDNSILTFILTFSMASVAKHPNSPYWYACYTARDGRQLKRSTKTADRKQALKMAMTLEAAEDKARAGVLTTTQLQKILSDVSEDVTGARLSTPTIEAYLGEWLQGIGVRLKPNTRWMYENTVRRFLAHLGGVAKRPVSTLAPTDVEGFLTARFKEGLAPKTVPLDLRALNAAFKRAEAYGVILKNPVAAVRAPKVESSEREVFTLEEIETLLAAAPTAVINRISSHLGGWRSQRWNAQAGR